MTVPGLEVTGVTGKVISFMSVTSTDPARAAAERLAALADDLSRRGFAVTSESDGQHRLRVASRGVAPLSEDIYVAPADDGAWWFWWSWADRIAPIDDVDAAAFQIAYVLSPNA